jgi:ABC-type uncharacterized transport system substrate-binding protein
MAAFRQGLNETGYIEGQSVAIEYRWTEGRYESMPDLVADLLRSRVTVIATPGSTLAALTAKAATAAVPIIFAVGEDPVKLGLVASLARPGGNLTGVNFLNTELVPKQLERDDFSLNRHPALASCSSMIFSENRCTLFRIML